MSYNLSIPSRIIITSIIFLLVKSYSNFQFHQGLSWFTKSIPEVCPNIFQFHQGLSGNGFIDEAKIEILYFQFHQGLSNIEEQILTNINETSFNSIKDYQNNRTSEESQPPWSFQFHQGLSTVSGSAGQTNSAPSFQFHQGLSELN